MREGVLLDGTNIVHRWTHPHVQTQARHGVVPINNIDRYT